MHLEMAERQIGAVTVLDLVGKLTIDQDAQRLKDKINSLILQQRTAVVLNLRAVPTSTAVVSANSSLATAHSRRPLAA